MNGDTLSIIPSTLTGEVTIPPSKSLLHRAIIAASLAKGISTISPFQESDDILATLHAMHAMGIQYKIEDTTLTIKSPGYLKKPKKPLHMHDSASTLRFLIPLTSLLNKTITYSTSFALSKRPLNVYQAIFSEGLKQEGTTITLNQTLLAGTYKLSNLVSSQFVTGLLFALPLLSKDSKIMIEAYVSKPYIDLTIETLNLYGITIQKTSYGYYIKGGQTYKPCTQSIEGDYSQAAFYLAYGAIASQLKVKPLSPHSLQADKIMIDILKKMGAKIIQSERSYTVFPVPLKGITVDLNACPDIAPILALVGVFARGKTILKNVKRLRYKESDRIHSTVTVLNALGATIKEKENSIVITGTHRLKGGTHVDSFLDHRIAMMVSIASLTCEQPVTLSRAQAVTKSYPEFYRDLIKLGATIKEGEHIG